MLFFFSSRRRHTRFDCDWSSDVCSSDLASAVPRLLPKQITLVTANSRISLAGVAGATIGAGIAGAFAAIGPQWSLRWAALVYIVGLVLAIRLPSAVDSPTDEEVTGTAGP